MKAAVLVLLLLAVPGRAHADVQRTIAGSLQLDYLAVPSEPTPRAYTLDGATTELSLKMSVDFTKHASATVKMCFACHGFEAAAAFVDLRATDELAVRIGRMTPEFGNFPTRYDPANHRTSDKPLPYDMGRMLHRIDWNEGILPAPWVDNGLEVLGTHFFEHARIDYAAYVLSGPKAQANAADFDFVLSRSPQEYYVDNNSEPIGGARVAGSIDLDDDDDTLALGASAMGGHYDPDGKLAFAIAGVDVVAKLAGVFVRAEYLQRRTDMQLSPTTIDTFTKHGFYAEVEVPVTDDVDLIGRFDGLVRRGPVATTSTIDDRAQVLRYTGAIAWRLSASIRLKSSVEYYHFSDFSDELALHLGVATPF